MIRAIAYDRIDVVKLILDAGADVNEVAANDSTALLTAAKKGNVGVVDILLKSGANVNLHDSVSTSE